jgi:hypothetical protein
MATSTERYSVKPKGSVIQERDEWEGITLYWRIPVPGAQRYSGAAFLAFWLCGWAFGEVMVAAQLARGGWHLFLIGWLGAWTIGGGCAIYALWNLLRPSRPESVTLGEDLFVYDPGAAPVEILHWNQSRRPPDEKPSRPQRRKRLMVEKAELGKFVLDRVGERQRLSFDLGADRIEIGESLREPEREWLHAVLEDWRRS